MSFASRDVVVRFVLIAVFWTLYGLLGWTMASTQAFGREDLYIHIFDADIYPFIKGVSHADSKYPRTKTHPLFPLLFRPVGSLLRGALGSEVLDAVLLTSLAGAVCVAMAHVFLCLVGLSPLSALVWSAILGLSFAHLVFGSLPETFIFSAASVITLFVVLVKYPGSLRHFVPAGIVASGILVTNLVQGSIAFFVSLGRSSSLRNRLRTLGWFLGLVLAGLAFLGFIQRLIYPRTSRSFRYVQDEGRWLFVPRSWGPGLRRLGTVLRHVFVYSVVAPRLEVVGAAGPRHRAIQPVLSMPRIGRFRPVGVLAIGLWMGLMAASALGLVRSRSYRVRAVVALALSILFNLGLHYFYGRELFLYSADWMFLVVSLVAVGLTRGYAPGGRMARLCTGAALVLAICEAVNNGLVVRDLVQAFQQWTP